MVIITIRGRFRVGKGSFERVLSADFRKNTEHSQKLH